MNKQSTFVLLPTDKEIESRGLVKLPNGKVQIMSENDMIDYLDSQSSATKHQHLYILSYDEIKKGDWFYSIAGFEKPLIEKAIMNLPTTEHIKKIIATTNPELHFKESYVDKISKSDIEYIISLHNGEGKGIDVKQLACDNTDGESEYRGFIEGFNKHAELNADKTVELLKWIEEYSFTLSNAEPDSYIALQQKMLKEVEEKIQSLTKEQPKSDTVIVEYDKKFIYVEGSETLAKGEYYQLKLKDGNIIIIR